MNIQAMAKDIPVEGEHSIEGVDFITSGDQYLTFLLEKEQYAVDILCVEEIRSWENPTIIPNAPGYIKGVINMRGVIVDRQLWLRTCTKLARKLLSRG